MRSKFNGSKKVVKAQEVRFRGAWTPSCNCTAVLCELVVKEKVYKKNNVVRECLVAPNDLR